MDTQGTPARDHPDDEDFGTQTEQSEQNKEQPPHEGDRPTEPSPDDESAE
jgi:hypothetical protein